MENSKVVSAIAIIGILIFFVSTGLAVLNYESYNFSEQYLSELGVGLSAVYFNVGMVVTGFFIILFYIHFWEGPFTSKFAAVAGWISGLALMGVGIFSMSFFPFEHAVATTYFFIFSGIGIFFASISHVTHENEGIFAAIGFFISLAILFYILFYVDPIAQKIAVLLIIIWVSMASVTYGLFGFKE